ncbi:MAG: DNA-binding response OmpR family regulator [Planctomycetota bacterium]|jgi:DNA-binding response OmpR family regulator
MSNPSEFSRRLAALRHDLRNPVGHILGYGEMLDEELEGTDADELRSDLQSIHGCADRMVRHIDEYLGASNESVAELDIDGANEALLREEGIIDGFLVRLRTGFTEIERDDLQDDVGRMGQAVSIVREILAERLTLEHLEEHESTQENVDVSSEEATVNIAAIGGDLGQSGEILVVDDDPANRDLLARRLGRQGYHATCVESGDAALKFLESEEPDLVLLDLVMPGLDGEAVLRKLKADSRLRHLPVIMLSGMDSTDRIVGCILLGAEDYLFKPFNPVLLKARIAASLEKRRLRESAAPRLRLFVSSPSDVGPERRAVRRAVDRLNVELTGEAILVPVLWEEEPLVASETAQTQIVLPRDTDIYIGIFWARFGTPLPASVTRPDGTRYGSGSEFEFEDALDGQKANGKPDMLVYRKTAEPTVAITNRDNVLDSLEQHEQLQEFIGKWFTGSDGTIAGVYHAFASTEDFEELLETHLRKVVRKQLASSG